MSVLQSEKDSESINGLCLMKMCNKNNIEDSFR